MKYKVGDKICGLNPHNNKLSRGTIVDIQDGKYIFTIETVKATVFATEAVEIEKADTYKNTFLYTKAHEVIYG